MRISPAKVHIQLVGVSFRYSVACLLAASTLFGAGTTPATYRVRTLAGTSYTGDGGLAPAALLVQPEGIAVDSAGSIYIADAGDSRVRKVDSSGRISTVAGSGYGGFFADDGKASDSRVNAPYDVCIDSAGNVYIADLGNARIRKVSPEGAITTVAGGGIIGPDPVLPRPATEVQLVQPRNIAVDARGTLYISDFGAHRIYQVTPDGNLSIIAGTGDAGNSADGTLASRARLSSPAGIAVDAIGNIYVADSGNRTVKRIFGQQIMTVRDAAGRAVEFGTPTSVAVDRALTLYVADGSGIVTTVGLGGVLAFLQVAAKTVAVDPAGRLVVISGKQVQRFDNPRITIVAGTGLGAFSGDGRPNAEWRFSAPAGIARDSTGNLYIADSGNGRIRQLSPRGDLATVILGLGRPVALAFDAGGRLYIADAATGIIHIHDRGNTRVFSRGSEGKPFVRPSALAIDGQGNLFVADTGNNLVRKISITGAVTTLAGGGGFKEDTHPLRVRLTEPSGLAFDSSGNLWFTEAGSGLLRKLSPAGELATLNLNLKEPRGIRVDSAGNLYICEAGGRRVIQATAQGDWWPIAGIGEPGISDAEAAALDSPFLSPVDLVLDTGGRITIADSGSGRIRELMPSQEIDLPPDPITRPSLTLLHAATLQSGDVAPGQLLLLRGDALVDEGHTLPAETEITIEGASAAVLSVSRTEILAQLPPGLGAGISELRLVHRGVERARSRISLASIAPGIFTTKSGTGQALAANEDGTINSIENPADRGTIVALFGTGDSSLALDASVQIGGLAAEVVYAGPAPRQPGVFQINVRTPAGFAPSGVQTVHMTIGGIAVQSGVTIVTH